MAVMLVENMSAHFDPARYHDDYREAVIKVVESKLSNQPIERPEVQETGKVTDLMAALKASVEAAKTRRAEIEPTKPKPTKPNRWNPLGGAGHPDTSPSDAWLVEQGCLVPPWRLPAIHLPFRSPTPPQLPGYIPVEASVPCAEPFDDRDWLFSVDWDGARALLFLDPGGAVRLQGELPGDLAVRFPDVSAAASVRGGRGAVLDGVIAVLDREGRPDLAGFGRRLAAGAAAAAELPAVYLCSDVLHLDGRSVDGMAAGPAPGCAERADRSDRRAPGALTTCAGGARRSPRLQPGAASRHCLPGERQLRTGREWRRPTACASRSRTRRPAWSPGSSPSAGARPGSCSPSTSPAG